MVDLSGTADILAHLRGSEKLRTRLLYVPEKILEVRDKTLEIWFKCYDELFETMSTYQEGSIDWMGLWAPIYASFASV